MIILITVIIVIIPGCMICLSFWIGRILLIDAALLLIIIIITINIIIIMIIIIISSNTIIRIVSIIYVCHPLVFMQGEANADVDPRLALTSDPLRPFAILGSSFCWGD